MGISNGLEIGSMDSETMSVCNNSPIKANAGQKDSDVRTAFEIIDHLKANHMINSVSPIPQEVCNMTNQMKFIIYIMQISDFDI